MITQHHIYPKSRGGRDVPNNIAYVEDRDHRYYHALFGNRTPREIIVYLNRTFWNEQLSEIENLALGIK
jgi:hypothetical protein